MQPISVDEWQCRRLGVLPHSGAEKIAEAQLALLRNVVARAGACSPFYGKRLAGIDPASLRSPADVARLPFTTGEDVRAAGVDLCVLPQSRIRRIVTQRSSGSTGNPKRIAASEADIENTLDFFDHGMRTISRAGDRVLIFLPCAGTDSIGRLLSESLVRYGAGGEAVGVVTDYEAAAERLRTCRPHVVCGLPVQLLRLAQLVPELRPDMVLFCSDYAPPSLTERVRRLWHCDGCVQYGMTETGFGVAVECRAHGGLHILHANVLLEVVEPQSGETLPAGEMGEVVITTLRREAMPLIRYRTGDLGVLGTAPCSCGGCLPRLVRMGGRVPGPLARACGLTAGIVDDTLFALPGLWDASAALVQSQDGVRLQLSLLADSPSVAEAAAKSFDIPAEVHMFNESGWSSLDQNRKHVLKEVYES